MAIALGKYEFATAGLLQHIAFKTEGYDPEDKEHYEEHVKPLEEIFERIRTRDIKWLNAFVAEKERISCVTLGLET